MGNLSFSAVIVANDVQQTTSREDSERLRYDNFRFEIKTKFRSTLKVCRHIFFSWGSYPFQMSEIIINIRSISSDVHDNSLDVTPDRYWRFFSYDILLQSILLSPTIFPWRIRYSNLFHRLFLLSLWLRYSSFRGFIVISNSFSLRIFWSTLELDTVCSRNILNSTIHLHISRILISLLDDSVNL